MRGCDQVHSPALIQLLAGLIHVEPESRLIPRTDGANPRFI